LLLLLLLLFIDTISSSSVFDNALFVLYRTFDVASSLLMLAYQNVSPWAVFALSFLVKAGNH